ncbi:MAG: hypothetical protein J6Q48_04205 [Bacteroidaceae bacterium]|nr:hypothetical protein [Bacteroidaceae bacterium]
MKDLSEKELTPYENFQITMLISYALTVFDMESDSLYGDYEVCGDDKDGRHISIKVTIDKR